MKKDRWSFIEVALCCALTGCSAAAPMTTRGNGTNNANGAAAGSGKGGAGTGDLGNANGGPLGTVGNGTAGVGTTVAPPPPVDPSAPTFKRDDTPMSGLDAATVTALKTATAKCAVTVTYPYQNTVFPGGLMPPVIMFDGAADAAYLHFTYFMSDKVDYEFAAKVTAPNSIQIARDVWNEITRRTNNYALQVTLNVSSGGQASTCPMNWKIAPGNMIGAIYYNTYQAPSPGVPGEGAVMRQSLGATAEIYKQYTDALNRHPEHWAVLLVPLRSRSTARPWSRRTTTTPAECFASRSSTSARTCSRWRAASSTTPISSVASRPQQKILAMGDPDSDRGLRQHSCASPTTFRSSGADVARSSPRLPAWISKPPVS